MADVSPARTCPVGDGAVLSRARSVWAGMTGTVARFPDDGVRVLVAPRSTLAPPGWTGVVRIGTGCLVTTPDAGVARDVERISGDAGPAGLTDPARLRRLLSVERVLGPATLGFLDVAAFRPAHPPGPLERMDPAAPEFDGWLRRRDPADREQSGLAEITSPVVVLRSGRDVVAAAGYRSWRGRIAHLGVLCVPPERGRGFARMVASGAVADALAAGLLPQWRAVPEPSRRVARAIGFTEHGVQLSVRLRPGRP